MSDFREILALLDDDGKLALDQLDGWLAASEALLGAPADRVTQATLLGRLAQAWAWREGVPPSLPWLRHLGPEAHHVLVRGAPVEAAVVAVAAREIRLYELAARDEHELGDALIGSTEAAVAMLESLRDLDEAFGARVAAMFPELAALAVPQGAAVDHEAPVDGVTARPLLDHVALRVLARKLRGLERGDRGLFQRDEALSAGGFADEVARWSRVAAHGLAPVVRAALLHLDFAKGGSTAQRHRWTASLGVDLSVHNVAAARILERSGAIARFDRVCKPALQALVIALVESHGLAGQSVRGETPLAAFAPFVAHLRGATGPLADELGVTRAEAIALAADCLHLIDVCDTAGVREGLLTDELRGQLLAVRDRLVELALAPSPDITSITAELVLAEASAWDAAVRGGDVAAVGAGRRPSVERARLADRLARLRQGRQRGGEPRAEVDAAVAAIGDDAALRLGELLAPCQLWYAEAATGRLTPTAQLKVLAIAARAAASSLERIDPAGFASLLPPADGRAYHISLQPLVAKLHDPGDRSSAPGADGGAAEPRYRVRLIEAMLEARTVDDILSGKADKAAALGSFTTAIGGSAAVALDFEESAEVRALLTLLAIYEKKSSAAFHATLKSLCDLYDLRKDEFDRVANEASYLVTMNAARSDKARMLDHVRPGRVVEVGPGGGVVLDLLEERFPGSEVIGIDVSRMVVEALQQKQRREGRRWRIVEADAFALPDHVGHGSIDSVVFCSVLHEIYSYVERPRRFSLDSVRDLLRAAWETLVPGGRLVIRDGVAPEPAVRLLRFVAPDARELFDLFVAQFEGRKITFEEVARDQVRLGAWDAMEFLYTYTWGPESFPYEVREQYGVLPYRAYRAHILEWLPGARAIDLPPEQASYLQPGYKAGLAGKIELADETGAPVELPDSNCLLVFEKTA